MIQSLTKTKVVAVDIGCELTAYAIVDIRGNILDKDSFPTADYPNINQFVSALSEKVLAMMEKHGGYSAIRSMGVAAQSGNYKEGSIVNSGNLPWRGEIPLAAMLRDRLGMAVVVANDAHVSALGESVYGSAHGMRDFILVGIGKGLGSCMFSSGHVHSGHHGFAGEVGHTCVEIDGRECSCGSKGCLEAYCAADGIVQTAHELLEETDKPSLMRGCDQLTPETIVEFCNQGDELSIEVYRRAGHMLGMGLANYASVSNPEAIIITGSVAKAGKWLLEPANEAMEANVFHNVQGKIKLMLSTLTDEERSMLGAGALAWRVKEYSLFK